MVSQLELLKRQQRQLKISKRQVSPLQLQQRMLKGEKMAPTTTTQQIIQKIEEEKKEAIPTQVTPTPEKTYMMEVGKGGRKISMTSHQIAAAHDLLRQYAQGQSPSMSGRDPATAKLYGYLLQEHQERSYAVLGSYIKYRDIRTEAEKPVPQPGDPGFIGPVRPREGDVGFIGPVRPEYVQSAFPLFITPTPSISISQEVKRYEHAGYTKSEATKLAKESVEVGGMSFTPETAKRIIKGERLEDIQRGRDILGIGLGVEEHKPLISREEGTFFGNIESWFARLPKGEPLPYGLQETTEFIQEPYSKPEILTGEKFSPWLPQFYLGAKIEKTITKLGIELPEPPPKLKKVVESPFLISLTATLPLYRFFQPTFETGVTKQEQIQKQISKGRFEKLSKFYGKAQKDLVKQKTTKGQIKVLKKLAEKYVDKNNPQEVENFKLLVQKLYEEGTFKGIPLEYFSTQRAVGKVPDVWEKVIEQALRDAPQLKYSGIIAGLTTGIGKDIDIKPEQVGMTAWVTKERDFTGYKQTAWLDSALGLITSQKPKTKQKIDVITKTILAQPPKLGQPQLPKQIYTTTQITTPKLKTPELMKTPQIVFHLPKPIQKPKPIKKIPPFFWGKRKKRFEPKPETRTGFIAEVFVDSKKGGYWKQINKIPTYKSEAQKLALYFADVSLSARARIKPTNKLPKQQKEFKVPFFPREYKFRSFEVRKGVRKPLKNQFIELRRYRLDTPSEVRKIHIEKLLAERRKMVQQKQTRQGRTRNVIFDLGLGTTPRKKKKIRYKKPNFQKILGFS